MPAMDHHALMLGTPPAGARAVCVLVHGRGQTPEDMRDQVVDRLSAPDIAFVLPRAPDKSWYAAKAVDPMTDVTRHELAAGLDRIDAILDAVPGPVLLAGFSQGACLSVEHVLRSGPRVAALVALTGGRVGADAASPVAALAGLPTYLSGSNADPWIPVDLFAQTVGALSRAGAHLRADCLPGRSHRVSDHEIGVMQAMLHRLAEHTA